MLAALSNRRFLAYLITAALSDGGYWIAAIAQGWLVVKLTNSPFWLGTVAAVTQLPFLLFSLAGGDLADRFDRRTIVAVNNGLIAVIALITAFLVATGAISVWWLLVLGFAAGTMNALEHPVDRAWLYDLVGGRDLGSSIALSSLEWSIARTVGPALGGVAIATIGIAAGYAAYALLTLPLAALALVLRAESQPPPIAGGARTQPDKLRAIVIFSLFIATFTIGVTPYIALLPDIARNGFGADAQLYGLMAAAGGAGAIVGGTGLALAGNVRRKGRLVPLASFAGAALLALFTHVHALLPALLILGAMGAIDTLMYALANTYVQECSGDAQRGRANAIFSLAFLGGIPVGSLLLGIVAARIGTDAALTASAAVVCASSIVFWFGAPQARELG
ncbi:MAG: MFS transporter [Candidatus Velthaea sp.]|jgi:MFS family permease